MFKPFVLASSILSLTIPQGQAADAAAQNFETGLNLVQQIKESGPDLSAEVCRAADHYLAKADDEYLADYLADIVATRCAADSNGSSYLRTFRRARDKPVSAAAESQGGGFWNGSPYCSDPANTFLCEFNHDVGKGAFIMGIPGQDFPRTYLVCAMVDSVSSNFIAAGQTTRSKCRMSEVFWSSYVRYPAGPTKPFFNWLKTDYYGDPQKVPASFMEVCEAAFPEAKFCSPQLIVQPTLNTAKVNVCALHTSHQAFNLLGLVKLKSGSSRWQCDRFDFDAPVKKKNQTVAERRCTDYRGPSLADRCTLPWIPYKSWGQD